MVTNPDVRTERMEDMPAGQLDELILVFEVFQAHAAHRRSILIGLYNVAVPRQFNLSLFVHLVQVLHLLVLLLVLLVEKRDGISPKKILENRQAKKDERHDTDVDHLVCLVVVLEDKQEHEAVPDHQKYGAASADDLRALPTPSALQTSHSVNGCIEIRALDPVVAPSEKGKPDDSKSHHSQCHHDQPGHQDVECIRKVQLDPQ